MENSGWEPSSDCQKEQRLRFAAKDLTARPPKSFGRALIFTSFWTTCKQSKPLFNVPAEAIYFRIPRDSSICKN